MEKTKTKHQHPRAVVWILHFVNLKCLDLTSLWFCLSGKGNINPISTQRKYFQVKPNSGTVPGSRGEPQTATPRMERGNEDKEGSKKQTAKPKYKEQTSRQGQNKRKEQNK